MNCPACGKASLRRTYRAFVLFVDGSQPRNANVCSSCICAGLTIVAQRSTPTILPDRSIGRFVDELVTKLSEMRRQRALAAQSCARDIGETDESTLQHVAQAEQLKAVIELVKELSR